MVAQDHTAGKRKVNSLLTSMEIWEKWRLVEGVKMVHVPQQPQRLEDPIVSGYLPHVKIGKFLLFYYSYNRMTVFSQCEVSGCRWSATSAYEIGTTIRHNVKVSFI